MTASQVLWLFIALVLVETTVELLLVTLNLSQLRKHGDEMPASLRRFLDRDVYEKAVVYSRAKGSFQRFSLVYSAIVILLIAATGLLGSIESMVRTMPGYSGGVVFVLLASAIFALSGIPLSLYSTFVLEERFGFNRMTLGLWMKDFLKQTLISVIIMVPLLFGLLWFMDATGAFWWVYAFMFVAGLQLLLVYLFPVVIAPLFNKFTPLPEGSLREAIFSLAERVGFRASEIFVMDGSTRSVHSNAYFTGLGKVKRIVFFDTLLKTLDERQAVAVLAHEIGHEKMGHIKKGIALSLLMMCVGFFVLSRLVNYGPLYAAFGFDAPSHHAALVVFTLISGPVMFFATPLFSALSRAHEYQADRFAVRAVGGARDLAGALVSLHRENLANPVPHPLYSFFHYSHPTLVERIDAMERASSQDA